MQQSTSEKANGSSGRQKYSLRFLEPEDLLPCLHDHAACPCSERDESSAPPPILFFNFHFNNIIPKSGFCDLNLY